MSLKNYKKTEAVGSMNGDGNRSFRPGYLAPHPPFSSHLARFKCNFPRSISHKVKQARFKSNIPRSMSHKPKQAGFKCNIIFSFYNRGPSNRGEMNLKHGHVFSTLTSLYQRLVKQKTEIRLEFSG